MLNSFNKLKFVVGSQQIKTIYILAILLVFSIFFEILSLSILIPILSLLSGDSAGNLLNLSFLKDFFKVFQGIFKDNLITFFLIFFFLAYFLKTSFMVFFSWFQHSFSTNLAFNLSDRLFKNYMLQNYDFYLKRNSTDLLKNINNEIARFTSTFIGSLIVVLSELLIALTIGIFLILISPLAFFIIIISFIIMTIIFNLLTRNLVKKWSVNRNIHQKLFLKNIQQGFRNIKDIIILGKEFHFINYVKNHLKDFFKIEKKLNFLLSVPRQLLEFSAMSAVIALIGIFLHKGYEFQFIIVTAGLYVAAGLKLMPSVNRIISSFISMRYSYISLNIIYKELRIKNNKPKNYEKIKSKTKFEKDINFKNVYFKYPEKIEYVLNKVNIKIKSNNIIGLVGESGSGKTTFIDILSGLLRPTKGQILIDGKSISGKERSWQNNIGYIPQLIFLTDDTIKNNIAFGEKKENIDNQKINKVLLISSLKKFIKNLPLKLNYKVGEYGNRISGGQRQRIGIARALYNNPKVLIMDEATSALDLKTEKEIMKSIYLMKGKKTILISSHNKNILNKCDIIFKFNKGKILVTKY
jgi:ABC-type bacteriocin/lantibiotic exporter with double-glycine peptidase domain